jgi:nascent polypeptide-associated complex subunit alpha
MSETAAKLGEEIKHEVVDLDSMESPTLEDEPSEADQTFSKLNRHETKFLKEITKLKMKNLTNIARVTIRNQRNILFVISNPRVYKGSGGTYTIFGKLAVEDLSAQAQATAAQQFRSSSEGLPLASSFAAEEVPTKVEVEEEEEELEGGDETGIEDADITLVMQQAGVSRAKAVGALRRNQNDIVNAIMELTM